MLTPMELGARGRSSLRQRRQSRSCRSSRAFRVVFDRAAARDLQSHMRGIYGVPLDDERCDAGFDFGPCKVYLITCHDGLDTTPEPDLVADVFLPVV